MENSSNRLLGRKEEREVFIVQAKTHNSTWEETAANKRTKLLYVRLMSIDSSLQLVTADLNTCLRIQNTTPGQGQELVWHDLNGYHTFSSFAVSAVRAIGLEPMGHINWCAGNHSKLFM